MEFDKITKVNSGNGLSNLNFGLIIFYGIAFILVH